LAQRRGCRREEAIRGLLKRHDDKRLTIGAVAEIAQELGVSRSTMYRSITAYRAKGTVSSVEPRSKGRRKDTLVLDAKREKLIASTIHEIYLKPERPTMAYLIEQVRARCAQKGLQLPDRRTIKARVDRIDRRTVALKRKDAKGVKATKTVPGQYVTSRPLEVVQIDHTEVDVFLVDETTREDDGQATMADARHRRVHPDGRRISFVDGQAVACLARPLYVERRL
jgi:putative transposase